MPQNSAVNCFDNFYGVKHSYRSAICVCMYVCFAWSKVMCTHTHNATQCIVIEHRCIFTAESMEEISLFLSLSIPVRCCYCCFSSFYSFCSCAYTQHSIYAHCGLAYKHELHKPLICQRSALVSTSEHEHEH